MLDELKTSKGDIEKGRHAPIYINSRIHVVLTYLVVARGSQKDHNNQEVLATAVDRVTLASLHT